MSPRHSDLLHTPSWERGPRWGFGREPRPLHGSGLCPGCADPASSPGAFQVAKSPSSSLRAWSSWICLLHTQRFLRVSAPPPEFFVRGFAWLVCAALCGMVWSFIPLFPVPGQGAAPQQSWSILLWMLKRCSQEAGRRAGILGYPQSFVDAQSQQSSACRREGPS